MATISVETYDIVTEDASPGVPFWFLLCLGITWIILSLLVLQFTYTSIVSISIIVGSLFFFGAFTELVMAFLAPGWRWVHAAIGVAFVIGGLASFAYPGQTFGTLALLFGWYLLIKGIFDVVLALMFHGIHLWWLGLVAGIAQIALAFWAVGYVGRSATLLVLWVGIGAAIHGITTLVTAFQIRDAGREVI